MGRKPDRPIRARFTERRGRHYREWDGKLLSVYRHIDGHFVEPEDLTLGQLENAILDFLLNTSNRGYQLHFRDGMRIPLVRADMSGLDDFLVALADQLKLTRAREE